MKYVLRAEVPKETAENAGRPDIVANYDELEVITRKVVREMLDSLPNIQVYLHSVTKWYAAFNRGEDALVPVGDKMLGEFDVISRVIRSTYEQFAEWYRPLLKDPNLRAELVEEIRNRHLLHLVQHLISEKIMLDEGVMTKLRNEARSPNWSNTGYLFLTFYALQQTVIDVYVINTLID